MLNRDKISSWIQSGTIFSTTTGRLLLGWGKREWSKNPSTSNPAFYFPDFFLSAPQPWFEQEYFEEISKNELILHLSKFAHSQNLKYSWVNSYKSLFQNTFDELKEIFAKSNLLKAVPFITESANARMNQTQLLKSLIALINYAKTNQVHVYGFWEEDKGILGASPEILFIHHQNGCLETVACAGTIHAKNDKILLEDSKELFEHELVVKGILESLSPYGKVVLGNQHLLNLTNLVHLVTPISVQLEMDLPFEKIVKALHPTPAVGAFPQNEGRIWLEEYEKKISRSRFGAPAGFLHPSKKQSNCFVAIRNVQWNVHQMQISAGCGIVPTSDFECEWAEINLKLKAVKEMLAL